MLVSIDLSKAMAGDENEETDQRDADADGDEQNHGSTPHHHFPHVGFLDP